MLRILPALVCTLVLCGGCSRQGFDPRWELHIQSAEGQAVGDMSMTVGESLELQAVLLDSHGQLQGEARAAWFLLGGGVADSDLVFEAPAASSAVFTPSSIGQVQIQASFLEQDDRVAHPVARTGNIQVLGNQGVVHLELVSGNAQSGVAGQALPEPLAVRALNEFSQPVAAAGVVFSILQGGGELLDANPALTGANGMASMRLRTGTVSGENNLLIRAEAQENSEVFTDFVASTLPGIPGVLEFSVQPDQAYQGIPFRPQPQVIAFDAHGNPTNSTATVSLSVATGSGGLSGTTTVPMTGGIASFSDVAYDFNDTGVIIRAESMGLSADSEPFDVVGPPPGQCVREDERFQTTGGGCTDLATGLTWSNRAPDLLPWNQVVWDSTFEGSALPDQWDLGRTNDYPEIGVPCPAYCDDGAQSYCHALSEGGMNDWRTPSVDELSELSANSQAGRPPYLQSQPDGLVWSSNSQEDSIGKSCVDLNTGEIQIIGSNVSNYAYCVRGGRLPADHLAVLDGPATVGVNSLPPEGILVRIQDPEGRKVNAQGVSITVTTSLGGISGDTTEASNTSGNRSFDGWRLDTQGTATLTFSSPGLAPASYEIRVGPFPHTCAWEDENFQTAQGGCQHLRTGLVWSLPSLQNMEWDQAVWDSENPPGNVPPDEHDQGRTNDYASDPGTRVDRSTANYCHDLEEGGYLDWRLPSQDELVTVCDFGEGALTHFPFGTYRGFHSATTQSGDFNDDMVVHLAGCNTYGGNKDSNLTVICVRDGQ